MGQFKNEGDAALTLMEECGEMIQVIAKKLRFNGSWFEIPPGKDKTRYQELCAEMEDVMYQWERLKADIEAEADQIDPAFIDDQQPDNLASILPPLPPPLTLEMCKQGKVDRDSYYFSTVIKLLVEDEGYTHLGWLNEGIFPPALDDWMEQYRNPSGSYTIMVSHGSKLVYCVDMGD